MTEEIASRKLIAPSALANAARSAGPPLLFGVRLWLSVCLALYIAFWLELDDPQWAGTSAAIVCQPHLGASLRKGWYRVIGTVIGAVAIVILTACFPQQRGPFLVGLAVWGAGCAFLATLLRNFAAYAAALAGFTAAIIASNELGATGGPNGEVFTLAVTRATEICIGIVCAGVVLAGTDLGNARHRLTILLSGLAAEITSRFVATLARGGSELAKARLARRELVRQITALDPAIDEAIGESAQLRYRASILETSMDGLFAALASWRTVAVRLIHLPDEQAHEEGAAILRQVPEVLRSTQEPGYASRWVREPLQLLQACHNAARSLVALPASTPSLRLLADQAAEALTGISRALDGLALLMTNVAPATLGRKARLRIPDWLPALVNAGRALVTIGVTELFWIFTGWPNGALAITFAAIAVILFAPRADQAYRMALEFMAGTAVAAVIAGVVAFAVLPRLTTFAAFAAAIGVVLIPVGAGMAQPWHTPLFTAVAANFVPVLAPANQMTYDTVQFYNTASAIVTGVVAAASSFRLLPPLSPRFRAGRLLALTLRDLRRLARRAVPQTPSAWEDRLYGRLSVLPDEAEPVQRSQLLAALAVGTELIRLGNFVRPFDVGPAFDRARQAISEGNSAGAAGQLWLLDRVLSSHAVAAPLPAALQARASILTIVDALGEYATYFDEGASL